MKKLAIFTTSLCFILLLSSCSQKTTAASQQNGASSSTGKTDPTDPQILDPINPLEAYLQRTSGVNFNGTGDNATVTIRGVNSFGGNTGPLFVLNGTDVGQNYSTVAAMVRGMQIKSVAVLKGSDASIYGVRGSGGVIVIRAQ